MLSLSLSLSDRLCWRAVFLVVLLTAPSLASASPNCTTSNYYWDVPSQYPRHYRVNGSSFNLLNPPDEGPIYEWEGITAAVMAGDKWNEQAPGGDFVYEGTSTRTDLPNTILDCQNQNANYSLVVVVDSLGFKAATEGRCYDGLFAKQFIIKIHKKSIEAWNYGQDWNFSVGNLETGNQFDLVQTLTHEFGHTMDLGHPSSEIYAVMQGTDQGSLRQRDLYKWDLKCLMENVNQQRSLTAYRRIIQGGVIGPEQALASYPYGQISAGRTKQTGTWEWSNVLEFWDFSGTRYIGWQRGFNPSNPIHPIALENRPGIGAIDTVWRESDETLQRVLFATYEEYPTAYESLAKHKVLHVSSNNDFVNSWSWFMRHCTTMTGFMTCDSTSDLYTGKASAVAWDNYNNRTVVAWANQTRTNDAHDREIWLTVGNGWLGTLPQPDKIGITTSIPPAVACNAWSAGGYYDCVLAYVPQSSKVNDLRTKRFWSWQGPDRYYVQLEPGSWITCLQTASPVALWYSEGWWYIVGRGMYAGQTLKACRSQDGASWSNWTSFPDTYSVIGPSAVSYWQGSENTLVYAR